MTFAERAAVIEALERDNREHVARIKRQQLAYEQFNSTLQLAMALYIETLTAPLRALIAEMETRP